MNARLAIVLIALFCGALGGPLRAQSTQDDPATTTPTASPAPAASPATDTASVPASDETTDIDADTSPNDRPLTDTEVAELSEFLDEQMGVEEHTLTEAEAREINDEVGHEVLIPDSDLYNGMFTRFSNEEIPLEPDAAAYADAVWYLFSRSRPTMATSRTRIAGPLVEPLRKLVRYYVYLLTRAEMSFAGIRNVRGATTRAIGSVNRGERGEVRLTADETELSRCVQIIRRFETNLGNWAADLHWGRASTFATAASRQMSGWSSQRGMSEDNLLLVWMIWQYSGAFASGDLSVATRENVRFWRGSASELGAHLFRGKTAPSLRQNNETAAILAAQRPSWDQLGMSNIGPYNWLARAMHENPGAANWPVWGTMWRGANALTDVLTGRDAEGRPAAFWSSLGSYTVCVLLVTSDVYLAGTGVRLLWQGGRALATAGIHGARTAYFRTIRAAVSRMSAQSANQAARGSLYRNLVARELKRLRNAMPRATRQSQELATQAQQLATQAMRTARAAGQEAKRATGVVSTATGRTYTGVSGATEAVEAAPRLGHIRTWLQRFADRMRATASGGRRGTTAPGSLEAWRVENCAEWQAINNALRQGEKMENLVVYTVRNPTGVAIRCCLNCRLTTYGSWVASRRNTVIPAEQLAAHLRPPVVAP